MGAINKLIGGVKMLTVNFKNPFKLGIAEWDESNTAETIEIQVPNSSMNDYHAELEEQQGFAYANSMKMSDNVTLTDEQMKEVTEGKKEKVVDEDKEASSIVTQMIIGGASMKVCYKAIKKILSSGPNKAKINGDKVIDKNVIELIPHSELKRVLGYYILYFTNILD